MNITDEPRRPNFFVVSHMTPKKKVVDLVQMVNFAPNKCGFDFFLKSINENRKIRKIFNFTTNFIKIET